MEAKKVLKNIKYLKEKQELYKQLNRDDPELDIIIKIYNTVAPLFTDRQKKIIELHYFKNNNIIDTALKMGWSRKTVYRDLKEIEFVLNKIIKDVNPDINLDKHI